MTVYFARDKLNGLVKIGFSASPERRLQMIQSKEGRDLEVLAFIDGGREVEKMLHEQLRSSQAEYEWFNWTPEVQNAVDAARRVTIGKSKARQKHMVYDETGEDMRIAYDLLQRLIGYLERGETKYSRLETHVLPKLQEINPGWTLRRLKAIQMREASAIRFWMIRNMLEALGEPWALAELRAAA